jgi:pilus assembly protein CpaB
VGSRRTVVLIAAIVVAAVAAFATFQYLDGVQERANKGAKLVKVFVVKKDIPKGFPAEQAISEQYIREDSIQEKFRPTTALVNLDTVQGKVALLPLSANQVVVEGQFVDPRVEQITNSQRIPEGQVAITVSTDEVRGVAGLLVPGDKVDLIVSAPEGGVTGQPSQRLLFQNVNILFIGTNVAPQPGDQVAAANPGSGLITFSVPLLAAERIIFAQQNLGGFYMALVPPDSQPIQVEPVTIANLFTGGLTPYEG